MDNTEPPTAIPVIQEELVGDGIDYSERFVTSDVFETDSEAIAWAKRIAITIGFELIVASHKNDGKKERKKILVCSRGLRYRGQGRDLSTAKRKNTKTKWCNCAFRVRVQQLKKSGSWVVRVWPGTKGMHNHPLKVYPVGYQQIGGLSPASKAIVRDMTLAEAKPVDILAALKEQNPQDSPTIRHVYNYRNQLRRHGFMNTDDA